MLTASYINLNQTYITLTLLFLFIFSVVFLKLHLEVYVKTSDYDCDNPLLKIYDKAKARRCIEKQFDKKSELRQNMITETGKLMASISKSNDDYIALTDKYSRLNAMQLEQRAQFLLEKQQAIKDLANSVQDIKTKQQMNENALENMITDYKIIIYKNIGELKNIAAAIVDKLNKNIYKKNYKNQRKKFVSGYNSIQKYINTLVKDDILEQDADGNDCLTDASGNNIYDSCGNKVCINGTQLTPLSNEAKSGRKKR